MKKLLLILLILVFCSMAVYAAKYKVNTGGKVTTPSGSVQQSSPLITPQNLYNNYDAQTYVQTKQVQQNPVGIIDIVMDYSGSMAYWIEAAKNSMAMIVNQLPTTTQVGFRVFGHNGGNNPFTSTVAQVKSVAKASDGKYKVQTAQSSYLGNTSGSCSATAQLVPVTQYNSVALIKGMNSAQIGGSTPLTLALQQSVSVDFASLGIISPKKIILITDGGENCGGDPCAFARQLVATRKDITIDVVLVSSGSNQLRCLADTTGGHFYRTYDVSSFTKVLNQSMQNVSGSTVDKTEPVQNYEFINE